MLKSFYSLFYLRVLWSSFGRSARAHLTFLPPFCSLRPSSPASSSLNWASHLPCSFMHFQLSSSSSQLPNSTAPRFDGAPSRLSLSLPLPRSTSPRSFPPSTSSATSFFHVVTSHSRPQHPFSLHDVSQVPSFSLISPEVERFHCVRDFDPTLAS